MKLNFLKRFNLFAVLTLSMGLVPSLYSSARADDNGTKPKHPRRAQVNGRLNNQQKRVDQGLANGSLKPGQAQKIQNQDARIKRQEQRDAAQNGGHITKGEQKQLNHEENGVSHEINRDERKNTAQPPAGAPPAPVAPAAQ